MNKRYAFLFPGQGAQFVGMGRDFYDQFPVSRKVFEEADDLLRMNLSSLVFNGPADELTLTRNSQLAIFVTSIAILRAFEQEYPEITPVVTAGLSLGEYTALVACKKISFQEALPIVQARASFMDIACVESPGSMQVVLGLEPERVAEALKLTKDVWVANLNCPGQVVISGSLAGLKSAEAHLKASGAKRVLPLEVSGAFHSGLMASAERNLAPLFAELELKESGIDLVMNVPGAYVESMQEVRENLLKQVVSPVRWESGIRAIEERGVDAYIEIGPGKSLAGMNKRIGVTAQTYGIQTVTDLKELDVAVTR